MAAKLKRENMVLSGWFLDSNNQSTTYKSDWWYKKCLICLIGPAEYDSKWLTF